MIENTKWLELYQAALLEFSPEQLRQRIALAELAIQKQLLDLRNNDSRCEEELQTLNDALRMLRAIVSTECRGVELRSTDSAGDTVTS